MFFLETETKKQNSQKSSLETVIKQSSGGWVDREKLRWEVNFIPRIAMQQSETETSLEYWEHVLGFNITDLGSMS